MARVRVGAEIEMARAGLFVTAAVVMAWCPLVAAQAVAAILDRHEGFASTG